MLNPQALGWEIKMAAPEGVPSEGNEKQTKVKEQGLKEEISIPEGSTARQLVNEVVRNYPALERE